MIVIIGLYVVLWGKTNDYTKEEDRQKCRVETQEEEDCESASTSIETDSYKVDVREPLLSGCTHHIDN